MADKIDIFFDDLKCAFQRFEPKPGDVFVLTVPGEISQEMEDHLRETWNKRMKDYPLTIVATGDVKLELMKSET